MNDAKLDSPLANILIVDDTPDNLYLLSAMLTEQGYDVRCVINGYAAIMGAITDPPDLILLDIRMPQMSGYDVCKQAVARRLSTCINPHYTLARFEGDEFTVLLEQIESVDEGIETPEQLSLLRLLGCELGQGYLFAQPLDAEATEALFLSHPQW